MFANTVQLVKDAYNAGGTLYGNPTPKMNKIQKMLTRRAYVRGIIASALRTKEQSKRLGYTIELDTMVSMQMTLEDNAIYNKTLHNL